MKPTKHRIRVTRRGLTGHFISRTEPEAFFLKLYFNYYPIAAPGCKEKPKPTNALIPTSIAYAGGQMSFFVGMGKEVSLSVIPGETVC